MWRDTIVCLLILLLVLVVMSWLGGCSDEPTAGPAGPDKAYLGNDPDPESLVDTHILDGELDEEFPDDQQVYPYYVVHHGPEAGVYSFSEGDTVPDGAHVVLKARATTEEPTPQQFNVQGQFTAGALMRGHGPYFSFASTYSRHDLKPGWYAPHRGVAADTLRFEAGPFRYDVAMRGILNLGGDEVYRDTSPDTLTFFGNFPPCVQCIELGNIDAAPTFQYEGDCYDQACLDERPRLQVYSTMDPRYDPAGDPEILARYVDGSLWVRAATGEVVFEEPVDPTDWVAMPAIHYTYVVYLHGKDHPREHWAGSLVVDRIKGWRYQIDYAADIENAIADGGGTDDLDFLSGFDVNDNEPDPFISDLFIENDPSVDGAQGAWGLRVTVGVPTILMMAGRDSYWGLLRAFYAVSPPPPPGSPDEEILAWQAEPATQTAYRAWHLTTMQFSPGMIRAVAADQAPCEWNYRTSYYHYYQRTRIPHPNGRNCSENQYDQPPEIIEQGSIPLEHFRALSNDGEPVVKEFDLELYLNGEADPFAPDEDPPGWIDGALRSLTVRASRH